VLASPLTAFGFMNPHRRGSDEGFLRFLNTSRAAVFVQAFDLTSTLGDGALLHDVFGEKQCRSVEKGNGINNNPVGALGARLFKAGYFHHSRDSAGILDLIQRSTGPPVAW
jgi:hypothetical protein